MSLSPDKILTLGRSMVQHGPNSDRVYLMKLDPADMPGLRKKIEALAREHGYGKIFAKIPANAAPEFLAHGYQREACVPGYYRGEHDALFLGLFLNPERAHDPRADHVAEVLAAARTKPPEPPAPLDSSMGCRALTPADAASLAGLYRAVFDSYPFPIHDPAYLEQTMASHVVYFGVFAGEDKLVAAASSEMDTDAKAAEMTDFATLPDHRKGGLARHLLDLMQRRMAERGILTATTIARAVSFGMNITFARGGFHFGGTLVNNTDISGGIESMNVWYRSLDSRA